MKRIRALSVSLAISGVLGWVGACSTSVDDGDSESHFLATCPPGCASGLECLCGVCTKPCSGSEQCGALSPKATCVMHDSCSSTRSCEITCLVASDCGTAGFACDNGLCRKSAAQGEAGAGGQRGDASTEPVRDGSITDVYVPPQIDGHSIHLCEQPIDVRQCETNDLFVHDPKTNLCKDMGAFWCPNNDNGFGSAADCLAACPGAHLESDAHTEPSTPGILDWDGAPFRLLDGDIVTCWFPGTVTWSLDTAAATDRHVLSHPYYSRTSAIGPTCSAPMPDCGAAGITPHDVGAALRDPDVRAALLAGGATYGKQDDTGTFITVDGKALHVGSPCGGNDGLHRCARRRPPSSGRSPSNRVPRVRERRLPAAGGLLPAARSGPVLRSDPAVRVRPAHRGLQAVHLRWLRWERESLRDEGGLRGGVRLRPVLVRFPGHGPDRGGSNNVLEHHHSRGAPLFRRSGSRLRLRVLVGGARRHRMQVLRWEARISGLCVVPLSNPLNAPPP